jgi:hypothetical protein
VRGEMRVAGGGCAGDVCAGVCAGGEGVPGEGDAFGVFEDAGGGVGNWCHAGEFDGVRGRKRVERALRGFRMCKNIFKALEELLHSGSALTGVSGMEGSGPGAIARNLGTDIRNALKSGEPFAIRALGIEAAGSEAGADGIEDLLTMFHHQINAPACTVGADWRGCALAKATTDGEAPKPFGEVRIGDVQNGREDGNTHQGRREDHSLERDGPPMLGIEKHFMPPLQTGNMPRDRVRNAAVSSPSVLYGG